MQLILAAGIIYIYIHTHTLLLGMRRTHEVAPCDRGHWCSVVELTAATRTFGGAPKRPWPLRGFGGTLYGSAKRVRRVPKWWGDGMRPLPLSFRLSSPWGRDTCEWCAEIAGWRTAASGHWGRGLTYVWGRDACEMCTNIPTLGCTYRVPASALRPSGSASPCLASLHWSGRVAPCTVCA